MLDKVKGSALLVILLILALAASGGLFYFFQQERSRSSGLQAELQEIEIKQKVVEEELVSSRGKISRLEFNLREASLKIEELNQVLDKERILKNEAIVKMEELKVDLERQEALSAELEDRLSKAQKDMQKMNSQVRLMEARRIELESRMQELEVGTSGVELGKIVVSPDGSTVASGSPGGAVVEQAPAVPEGKVLVINKDYNFAVINLGSKDGVAIGEIFSVYHSNKKIGDIKVEKIHDSMAAAGFVNNDLRKKIREGDKVVVRK